MKKPTAKKTKDDQPHPFGDDRAARIERWRAMAIFGGADPLAAIAKLAVEAAEAPDKAEMCRRALFALGLHGPMKAGDNRHALREALDEIWRIVDAIYPQEDDDFTTPLPPPPGFVPTIEYDAIAAAREREEAGRAAQKRYDDMLEDGTPKWLYRRVKGNVHGDEKAHTQFLHRQAKRGTELRRVLDWALSLGPEAPPPARPVVRHSRGRVR